MEARREAHCAVHGAFRRADRLLPLRDRGAERTSAFARWRRAALRRVRAAFAGRQCTVMSRTVIHDGELLRHPPATRVLQCAAALFFVLALISGFAIYTPW